MRQLRNFNYVPKKEEITDKEFVNDALQKYGGMNEDQLVNTLLQSVQESKQNGTYDAQKMQSFAENIAPHISDAQREKLNNIIQLLNQNG